MPKKKKTKEEKLTVAQCYEKLTQKEIKELVKKGYVVFYNINWDTDGLETKLPVAVRVPLTDFEDDFNFEYDGADYLSDEYGFCIHSFSFKK